jgi:hypothetical protein
VPQRHTNRLPFTDNPVTPVERAALGKAAIEEGAWLHLVEDQRERSGLARLIAEAHAVQRADPAYQAEVARVDRRGRRPRRRRSRACGRLPARRT